MIGLLLFIVVVSYLLGSFPTGFLVARARGIDIRQHGSGNIGATNVFRTLGRKWGTLVFAGDVLKGVAAVRLAILLAQYAGEATPQVAGMVAAICCVVGHCFPCWLRFKGGKGIATSAGVLIGLVPLETLVILLTWLLVFYTTRYVSLASIAASIMLPVAVLVILTPHVATGSPVFYFTLAMAILVVARHRANIRRLLAGEESRFVKAR